MKRRKGVILIIVFNGSRAQARSIESQLGTRSEDIEIQTCTSEKWRFCILPRNS